MLYRDFDSNDIQIEYSRTSKGDQPKWKDGKYWYKQDMFGYEALAEVLVSALLSKSNLNEHAVYEPVLIKYNRKTAPGCCSIDFKAPGEELFTLERLHLAYAGVSILDRFRTITATRERIDYTVRFIEEYTNITDAGIILTKWLEADAFFLNEDRHTNNIAFLRNERTGAWRFCPYYDNGLALLSDVRDYPLDERLSDLVRDVTAKPFSRRFDVQVEAVRDLYSTHLTLDFTEDDVRNSLESMRELYDARIIERAMSLIRVQSNRYKELFGQK